MLEIPILDISKKHLKYSKDSIYVSKSEIEVKKLDDIFFDTIKNHKNIFLKIDTQGFEYNVISGAKESLKFIKLIQMEVSLDELYIGEKSFLEMCNLMNKLGFKVISIEPGFFNFDNGFLFQAEIIFLNKSH